MASFRTTGCACVAAVWDRPNPISCARRQRASRRRDNQMQMLMLLSLRPPPAAAHLLAAAPARTPLLRARRPAGPPPASASASASAEFPGIVLRRVHSHFPGPPAGPGSRVCSVPSKFQNFYKISRHLESLDVCIKY
jgi:hypothetical protein